MGTTSRRTFLTLAPAAALAAAATPKQRRARTTVSIEGDRFLINGRPTYPGRTYQGAKVEGLLMNVRLVQGIFDDLNPETAGRWRYPDTGKWDPDRNTREFVAAMPEWRRHGLLSFVIPMQGGSPEGYSKAQPWINNGFEADGSLRPDYMARLEKILNRADELGMVPMVAYFYSAQDQRLKDEEAIKQATRNATKWMLERNYRNVILQPVGETNKRSWEHEILKPPRIVELIEFTKSIMVDGRRYPVGVSYTGRAIPDSDVVAVSDFALLHGNGVKDPNRITEMVQQTRQLPGYRPMPILFNEDDHFDFDQPVNNMMNAVRSYASWGYFDPGKSN